MILPGHRKRCPGIFFAVKRGRTVLQETGIRLQMRSHDSGSQKGDSVQDNSQSPLRSRRHPCCDIHTAALSGDYSRPAVVAAVVQDSLSFCQAIRLHGTVFQKERVPSSLPGCCGTLPFPLPTLRKPYSRTLSEFHCLFFLSSIVFSRLMIYLVSTNNKAISIIIML